MLSAISIRVNGFSDFLRTSIIWSSIFPIDSTRHIELACALFCLSPTLFLKMSFRLLSQSSAQIFGGTVFVQKRVTKFLLGDNGNVLRLGIGVVLVNQIALLTEKAILSQRDQPVFGCCFLYS
jgi:hypothetical protein